MEYTFWRTLDSTQVQVVGINTGEDLLTAQRFAQNFGLTFPVLLDPQNSVYSAYFIQGISPFPRDVIIDQQGVIQYLNSEYDPQYMLETLSQLLPTGLKDNQQEARIPHSLSLQVFPNPTNSSAIIRFTTAATGSAIFRLFDLNGRMLIKKEMPVTAPGKQLSFRLNLNNIASGIYPGVLENGHLRENKKIILSK